MQGKASQPVFTQEIASALIAHEVNSHTKHKHQIDRICFPFSYTTENLFKK